MTTNILVTTNSTNKFGIKENRIGRSTSRRKMTRFTLKVDHNDSQKHGTIGRWTLRWELSMVHSSDSSQPVEPPSFSLSVAILGTNITWWNISQSKCSFIKHRHGDVYRVSLSKKIRNLRNFDNHSDNLVQYFCLSIFPFKMI